MSKQSAKSSSAGASVSKSHVKKKTANKKETKPIPDLEKYALVSENMPITSNPLTMDGTSHTEISVMLNAKYSSEIIKNAAQKFNFDKFKSLLAGDFNAYLEEGKNQILDLWQSIEALTVHTELFRVTFLIAMGMILNDVEKAMQQKHKYMAWLRDNFGPQHLRYFQHAKQLAKMGEFARNYASLGKNRLLEFARLHRDPNVSYNDLLQRFPFNDTAADNEGEFFKRHVDSIITFHRMLDAGIDFAEFQQAQLIADMSKGALTVNDAADLNKWISTFKSVEDKKKALDDLIFNRMLPPYGEDKIKRRATTLRKHFSDLTTYIDQADVRNDVWVRSLKKEVDGQDLIKIFNFILTVAEKLKIDLNPKTGVKENGQANRRAA